MSFPHTEDVINALVNDANPKNVESAVRLLRQYNTLCRTMENDIEAFRAAKDATLADKASVVLTLEKVLLDKQEILGRENAMRIEKELEISTKEDQIQAALMTVNVKEQEKQNIIDDLQARLGGKINELNELKLHPALVMIDTEARNLKIASLKAELAKLQPQD